MKQNINEVDVDFIGGAGPLTKAEEKAISEFLKAEKAKRVMKKKHTTKTRGTPEQNSLHVKPHSGVDIQLGKVALVYLYGH